MVKKTGGKKDLCVKDQEQFRNKTSKDGILKPKIDKIDFSLNFTSDNFNLLRRIYKGFDKCSL